MLALALTLQLFGGTPPAPPSPDLHLVPPLALAADPDDRGTAPAGPDLSAPANVPAERWRWYAGASLGALAGDVIAGTILVLAINELTRGIYGWGSGGGGGGGDAGALLVLGTVTWLFLPPALAVRSAVRAGAPAGSSGLAYWAAFAIRIAGVFLVSAAADKGLEWLGAVAFAANELVVAPWIAVRILERGAERGAGAPMASPAQLAVPVTR